MGRHCKACEAAKTLLGCCLGASPPSPAAPAAAAPAAAPAPAPQNGGAQDNGGEGIPLQNVAPQNTSTSGASTGTSNNTSTDNTNAPGRPRPASLPAAAPSESRPKKARVSCRPYSALDLYGPPPSPPPNRPLPPIPEHARRRNSQQATTSTTTSRSQRGSNSQQGSNSKQATNSEQLDKSEQLLSESHLSDSCQQSDSSGETIDSAQLDELLQIGNSQQADIAQQTDVSQITCNLVQLDTQRNLPIMESVILHPLPVISIGDYVTRHKLREQPGPIVGALFGQQNGREVTIETAYEVQTLLDGDQVTLEPSWFETRLEQMRLVHKDRTLDLVGWFTVNPRSGPGNHILPIHNQILAYNESAILLGFHSEEVGEESVGGKLPFSVYETAYEVDDAAKDTTTEGEDKEMKDGDSQLRLKFRELPFTVETHEAEMIGMTSVAGAAANAASERVQEELLKLDVKGKGKGKAKQAAKEDEKVDPENAALSKEDQEMISALTTKANAIKMLQARIDLIIKYLQKLPPPYMDEVNSEVAAGDHTEPSQTLLRLVQALVHRLSIIEPSDAEAFQEELLSEENDVSTIELLTELMNRAGDTRDIGKKFHAIETEKAHNSQRVATYASQGAGFGHSQPSKGGRPGSLSAAGDLM
ncbi:hypothetical protein INS49_000424 [Diaporthe citri]|uniref:uncharacterized protein n=1 Tax=Diaporthe citri TaxID=83186 RepID=UPI001C80F910|nr:uncharacterized protein INS49_000424 [Diaporthe citri]KAG6366248.1 hypothetical protein INS49_000424 [Diaporthe citri]